MNDKKTKQKRVREWETRKKLNKYKEAVENEEA